MTLSIKDWFSHMAYFFTPETSVMVLPHKKTEPFDLPPYPVWAGTLKATFWIAISIGVSVLIFRQL